MRLLNDFSTTVEKSLDEIDPKWREYPGLIVCGTHCPHDEESMIEEIKQVRQAGTPFLGICFGHQLAAIEYARNVLGIKHATSEEFNTKDGFPIVVKLKNLKVGMHEGESYWNNYEVLKSIIEVWHKAENFITCQFHPEYQSSTKYPHKLLVKYLEQCKITK